MDFYPRSPRGERPTSSITPSSSAEFLSTLPARGATNHPALLAQSFHISIHAPREGSDPAPQFRLLPLPNFYPRSPRGERPPIGLPPLMTSPISIHAPREGSD